ncbi:MAG: Holliday junction branch migration protein RuvA [Candidatus Margulisiibacteriota bacterium]
MIFSLTGTLNHAFEDSVVIETGGVGYQVFVHDRLLASLTRGGNAASIYIYHHVREDQQTLFGFADLEERELFMLLTSVSGVGPKVGQKFLAVFSSQEFVQALLAENVAALTQVPGVGKKVAERLVVELKDKVAKVFGASADMMAVKSANPASKVSADWIADLTLAMKTLGYSQGEVQKALTTAADQLHDTLSLEEGIKLLLKRL